MENHSQETGLLTIDLAALADNYRLFQDKVGENCLVAGIVKANAYGLGAQKVVATLIKSGCRQFFVATLQEAVSLKSLFPDISIAVLGGLFLGAEKSYVENNITPVLNSIDDIHRWSDIAKANDIKLDAMLHIDTGMNRLGLRIDEAKILVDQGAFEAINIPYIMSHFACADEAHHPMTAQQAKNFADVAQYFPNAKQSLGNSSGLFRDDAFQTDMVRPGYALYGGNPTPETNNPMKQVISLKAKILQIRHCQKGESIGYGAHHVFDKDTTTATIGIGYADGFYRSNSGKASFYIDGVACPVLGRVSMDLTSIDISALPSTPKQGDWVEIIGANQSIDDLAKSAGTIGYEILTSLGTRFERLYINQG